MKIFVGILLALLADIASGQNYLSFEHLSIEDGLANNSVRTVFQDKEGYLWFGTLNGLSRYDGKQFKNFVYNPADSLSVSSNKIREIFQDGLGYIWLTTYDEQAHRFDPKTETFINFPSSLGPAVKDYSIHFIYETSPGVMWMYVVGKGCVRIMEDPAFPSYSVTWFNSGNILPSDGLNFISSGKKGGAWIGTSKGLCFLPDDHLTEENFSLVREYLVNPAYSVMTMYDAGDEAWVGCQKGQLFKISSGKQELVWTTPEYGGNNNTISFIEPSRIGTLCVGSRKGMLLIDEATGQQTHLTTRNSSLNTSYIVSCYHDSHDDFWLVTSRRGITRFEPASGRFTYYPLHPEIRQSILEGEKQVFLEDRNGDLWIGIYGGGVSRFNRQTGKFEQFLHEDNNPGSLSSNLILSIFSDRSGNLWAGTYKRGLNKINLRQNNFYTLNGSFGVSPDFEREVRSVYEDSRGWVWTGNKRGKIVVYDRNLKLLFSLDELPGHIQDQITSGVYAFEEDHNHFMWIGTKGNGIFILKNLPRSAERIAFPGVSMVHLAPEPENPNSLSHKDVFDLCEDRLGQMWVALYHGGVNVIRNPLQSGQQVLHYLENDDDRFSVSDNRVRCLFEDNRGNMWIGTANGLNFLDARYQGTDDKKFQLIERTNDPNSLSYNDIICVFQDSSRTIWIGTYGGGVDRLISGGEGKPFKFSHLTTEKGLSSNLVLSIIEDNDKNLWIGTDFGLCKYQEKTGTIENYYAADGLDENTFSEGRGIKISSNFLLFGNISGMVWFNPRQVHKSKRQVPVVLTNMLINGHASKSRLNEARDMLNDSVRSLRLRYNENFLTFEFAALDYKAPSKVNYAFKLENFEQEWNYSGNLNKAIYRELKPGKYLFRMKASNSDGLWVNPELKLWLTIAPPPWMTAWAYFVYLTLAVALFFLARRIVLERIRLKHEVRLEKQMAEDKLKFYTSISHEFKTPLALILGPVEDLLAGKDLSPSVRNPLKMVRRNTQRLLELIEQLMDFRKIQKGFFKVVRKPGDVVRFLDEIYQTFAPIAGRKNIEFIFTHDLTVLNASFDEKSLEKIVFNLLSNAFKHTDEDKKIELRLEVCPTGQQMLISVTDQGEGIREQDLPHIFDRFTFGNHSRWRDESSTGIGLSLTRELVELLGGKISVTSTPGKGSRFVVELPLIKEPASSLSNTESGLDLNYSRQFIRNIEAEEADPAGDGPKSNLLSKETVLVVEDNADLRSYLVRHLSETYLVLQAVNGKEGLELAKTEFPDMVVCDIMMPEMDGIEMTRLLKNEFHTSHIPVILLTAKSLDEQKIEGIETGADDYITKPFNMVYLQKRIENILKQRKQLKERYSRDLEAESGLVAQSSADKEFLDKVVRLIEENLSDPNFSIDELLEHFSFGRTIFYKKMKGVSGYSPKDFIRIIRMKKAGTLLRDTDLSVAEVSADIGLGDPNYFSKLFKKHFGENPSEYQKRQRDSAR